MGKVKDQKGDLAKQFPEISANIREHFGKEAFSEDDVRHAYCFCMRVPRKQTQLLSELHFALVSPSVIRMLPADFGAISRIDKDYPNVKAHARPCVCTKQALAHMACLSSRRYTCAYVCLDVCTVCVGLAMLADRPRAEHLSRIGRNSHGDSACGQRYREGSRLAAGLRNFITCSYVSFSAAQGLRLGVFGCFVASAGPSHSPNRRRNTPRLGQNRSESSFVCLRVVWHLISWISEAHHPSPTAGHFESYVRSVFKNGAAAI